MKSLYLVLIPALTFIGSGQASESTASALWRFSAELGFVSTTGNTETETLNAKASASTDRKQWRHKIDGSVLRTTDGDNITGRQFNLAAQSDYRLEKNSYLFAALSYEDDKFSGYDYIVTVLVGYGWRVIDENGLILDLEAGPGSRQSKLDTGDTSNEGLVRAAAKLDSAVGKTSQFSEVFTVEASGGEAVTKSVTSLSSRINGNLSMKMTYTLTHTSQVPVNVDKTDRETTITLVFNF